MASQDPFDAAMEEVLKHMKAANSDYAIERLSKAMETLARSKAQSQTQALRHSEALVKKLLEENRRLWDIVQDDYRQLSGFKRVPTTRAEREQGLGASSDNTPERALAALEGRPSKLACIGMFECNT